jgi:futalosine hydrolase
MLVSAATERELACAGNAAEGITCGIGPVEAAISTAQALARTRPDAVLHVGVAGAAAFAGPELVLGSDAVYCDTDSQLVPSRARPDPALLAAARASLPDARICSIGTSARVGGATGAEVEAMEGFAVLRACELAGVPALEVRATSNAVDEPDRGRWQLDEALELLRSALPGLLEALGA